MQLLGLSILDYLLIFIVFLGGIVGLIRGILPQAISLASLWFSLLATLWTYRLFSDNILQGLGISKIVSDTLSFLLILFISFQAIRLLIKSLTVPPEEKKKKPRQKGKVGPPVEHFAKSPTQKYILGPLSAISAIILGLVLTTVWMAVFLGVLQFIFQVDVSQAASDVSGVTVPGSGFAVQLRSSTLIHYFNLVLLWLVRSVSFFVFDSGPNILEVVINRIFPPG